MIVLLRNPILFVIFQGGQEPLSPPLLWIIPGVYDFVSETYNEPGTNFNINKTIVKIFSASKIALKLQLT